MKRVWQSLIIGSVLVSGGILVALSGRPKAALALPLVGLVFLLTAGYPIYRLLRRTESGRQDDGTFKPPDDSASPVPWVAEAVWRSRNERARFGEELGTHEAKVQDGVPFLNGVEPRAFEVADVRAPLVARVFQTEAAGMTLRERLTTTPDVWAVFQQTDWPSCCGRLTTLVSVQPTAPELDRIERLAGALDDIVERPSREPWAEALRSIRRGEHPDDGVNVFCCEACHHLYGVHSHT